MKKNNLYKKINIFSFSLSFSLSLFLSFSLPSFAQTNLAKVKWGEEFKMGRGTRLNSVIGYDSKGIIALESKYSFFGGLKYHLLRFDENFNIDKAVELDMSEGRNDKTLELPLMLGSNLALFSSFVNEKHKKRYYFVQSIDKKTLALKRDIRKIAEVDYSGKFKSNTGSMRYAVSRDSSKVLLYFNHPYRKGDPETFGFTVIDKDLNELWTRDVTLPYNDELFEVKGQKIDNQGNIYVFGKLYKDRVRDRVNGKANYTYQVFTYSKDSKNPVQYPVELDDRFITDMQIAILDNLDVVCAGFYSERSTYGIKGAYYLTIDGTDKKIKSKNFKEFPLDFLTQNTSRYQERRILRKVESGDGYELANYDLDKLIVRGDGGCVLIGEQYYVTTQTYYNYASRSSQTVYYYNYNDIIVVNINPNGEIAWAEKVPKQQTSVNDGGYFLSYTMATVRDKLFFIFNDDARNIGNPGDGRLRTYSGYRTEIALASVDRQGKKAKGLLTTDDLDVRIVPKSSRQSGKNEVILFGQRGKTQQFGRVTFE
ncbi:MAG: hypothetical protein RLZZ292_2251 [Bacteroidota bacterium]|jgi:hypothetical protein